METLDELFYCMILLIVIQTWIQVALAIYILRHLIKWIDALAEMISDHIGPRPGNQ